MPWDFSLDDGHEPDGGGEPNPYPDGHPGAARAGALHGAAGEQQTTLPEPERDRGRTAGAGARPLGTLLRQDGAGLVALDDAHRNVRLQHYEPPAFNFLPQTSETVREPVENGVY